MTICGLDEAGRGALAGPLVAAAVLFDGRLADIEKRAKLKVKDSKLLTAEKRIKIYTMIQRLGIPVFVEVITTRQINNHGIGWANKEIFHRLIRKIEADSYIVDGNLKLGRVRRKTKKIRSVVDADATIPTVILAGIVAKVERDKLMRALHKEFPRYQWGTNAGYGTATHIEALVKFKKTRYHRNIFVATALKNVTF